MHSPHLISLAVSHSGGPGTVMRSLIVITVVGVALIAWFVLRGYGNND